MVVQTCVHEPDLRKQFIDVATLHSTNHWYTTHYMHNETL